MVSVHPVESTTMEETVPRCSILSQNVSNELNVLFDERTNPVNILEAGREDT